MAKNLRVMDQTALALCNEQKVPVLVFDFRVSGNIARAVRGDQIGTVVYAG
jgi:uridylate kinase